VNLHARAAGIGKYDFHAFTFKGLDENVAPEHGRADFGAFRGGGFLFRSGSLYGFAHTFFRLWLVRRGQQKTHSRCQPWVLVKIDSTFDKHQRRR
jgi:hypothetical protein